MKEKKFMSVSSSSSTEYHFQIRDCFLGAQMLFVAFGALVLVPLLTGLDPMWHCSRPGWALWCSR